MSFSIVFAGLLIIVGHASKVLFDKTRVPDVIPMVLLGLLVGPVLGLLTPDKFGIMGEILGTLAISIILFYSGLEINIKTANKSLLQGTNLSLLNFVITSAIAAVCAKFLLNLSYVEAVGAGAILGGTSFAIVVPMLTGMTVSDKTKTVLLLESTFTDVLCIIVSLGIFQMIRLKEMNAGLVAGQIIASFVMSSLVGGVSAFFWGTVLKKVRKLENDMLLTPAFIVIVFGLTEFLGYSGAVSSLVFGVVSGNIKKIAAHPFINKFTTGGVMEFNNMEVSLFSELVFVLKTFFFFYIGLSIKMTNITMALAGFGLVVLIFFGRLLSAKLLFDAASGADKMMTAIMGPKGLVSVVLLSLAVSAGFSHADLLQELIYSTILSSIIFSALMSFAHERGFLEHLNKKLFNGAPQKAEGA